MMPNDNAPEQGATPLSVKLMRQYEKHASNEHRANVGAAAISELGKLEREIARLRADRIALVEALNEAEFYLKHRITGTGGFGETKVLPLIRAALTQHGGER